MRPRILFWLALALAAPCAFAVDGVVLVNQSTVMASGGFPYTISQPGSYKLSGNLVTSDPNKDVIVIAADHVSLDLGGFSILGPTDCSGGLSPCNNSGTGSGIRTDRTRFNITVMNGTIQGMGRFGISLSGDSHRVESMHVRSNGFIGIYIPNSADIGASIAQDNTVQRNGSDGIIVLVGLVNHNTVSTNGGSGITINDGSASDNFVNRNLSFGLSLGDRVLYKGNSLDSNVFSVGGGVNMGQNLCNGVACPGAVF